MNDFSKRFKGWFTFPLFGNNKIMVSSHENGFTSVEFGPMDKEVANCAYYPVPHKHVIGEHGVYVCPFANIDPEAL